MPGRLQDKVALVTGAGSIGDGWGNGKATAVLFAREGAKVSAVDINAEAVAATAEVPQRPLAVGGRHATLGHCRYGGVGAGGDRAGHGAKGRRGRRQAVAPSGRGLPLVDCAVNTAFCRLRRFATASAAPTLSI